MFLEKQKPRINSCAIRNIKGSFSRRKYMIPGKNLDLYQEMNDSRNGNNEGKYKILLGFSRYTVISPMKDRFTFYPLFLYLMALNHRPSSCGAWA